MIPVTEWSLIISTLPPNGSTFAFQAALRLATGVQTVLRVETMEEFMAIVAILQITNGKLFFNPVGQSLNRVHIEA